jgi:hypothetical protein
MFLLDDNKVNYRQALKEAESREVLLVQENSVRTQIIPETTT